LVLTTLVILALKESVTSQQDYGLNVQWCRLEKRLLQADNCALKQEQPKKAVRSVAKKEDALRMDNA
jgi:hypothetical protein